MLYPKNQEKQISPLLFQNPTCEYRGAPFWAWNCVLTKELLEKEIKDMKAMGLGGFHMHPRSGLYTPYLSDEFMALIRVCQEIAEKEGMLAWLYDEDRWPSGFAGGLVTKNPVYRQKSLVFTEQKMEALPKEEAIQKGKTYLFACYDIVLNDKGEMISCKIIDENDVAMGKKRYAYIMATQPSPRYNFQTHVDTLSKEAMDAFIDITYETYKKHVGNKFGTTHPAIFTDEPLFRPFVCLPTPFSSQTAYAPWTTDLPETYKAATGYTLKDILPQLYYNIPGTPFSRPRYLFHDHVCERFNLAFMDNCYQWCENNNLPLTGHMMDEFSLGSQTRSIGETMRAYRGFQLPGIDILCERMELTTAKQCQSAVHQYGREGMLSELYGVTDWDYDFRGHKFQGDWQAALGVSIRVHHLTWASMKGSAKRDYPACIGYQSPWYKEYAYVEDHFARINTVMTRGKPVVKLGVIHPIESFWLAHGDTQSSGELKDEMEHNFEKITEWLLYSQNDFDFISESILPSLYKEGKGFTVGEMSYEIILLPPMKTIRSTTLDALESFASRGGKIIFAGEIPFLENALPSDRAKKLASRCITIPFTHTSIMQEVEPEKVISIRQTNGMPANQYLYQLRRDGNHHWVFIANGKKPPHKEVIPPRHIQITIQGEHTPVLYDTLTGNIAEFPCLYQNGNTVIPYLIHGHDSILFRLNPGKTDKVFAAPATPRPVIGRIEWKQPISYTREEDNVYILDLGQWKLNDGDWQPEEELLRIDLACRKILGFPGADGDGAQPWVIPDNPVRNTVTVRFVIPSQCEVASPRLACEELLSGTLNGEPFPVIYKGYFADMDNKTLSLPPLKKGENLLELIFPLTERISTEYCYLLGDFDVSLRGCEKTVLPPTRTLGFSSITSQGMPFYGGNLTYTMPIEVPDCDLAVRANHYRGALLKVYLDGKEQGHIVYSPYRLSIKGVKAGKHILEIKYFGNRYNTFGALHNANPAITYCSPAMWYTTGENWSYEYQVRPTGILASPVVEMISSEA